MKVKIFIQIFLGIFIFFGYCGSLYSKETFPEIVFDKTLELKDFFYISKPVFSANSKYVAAFFNGIKTINVYDVETAELLVSLGPGILFNNRLPDVITFTGSDDENILILKAGKPAKLINWKDKKVLKTFPMPEIGYKINSFDKTSDSKYFAVGTKKGLQIWNLSTGRRVKTVASGKNVLTLDISPDNNNLIYSEKGYATECVRIIDMNTLEQLEKPLAKLSKKDVKCISNHKITYLKYIDAHRVITAFENIVLTDNKTLQVYLLDTKKATLSGAFEPACRQINDIQYFDNINMILLSTTSGAANNCSGFEYIDLKKMNLASRVDLKTGFISAAISHSLKWAGVISKNTQGAFLSLYSIVDN